MTAGAGGAVANPGDIGRRVAWRRQELGLTRDDLAQRVGMAASFIQLLETRAVNVTWDGLSRLAYALQTNPETLLGADVDLPPGRGPSAPRPELEILPAAECLRLIAPGGVGRVGLLAAAGPEVLPVNYVLDDARSAVLFRTRREGVFARHVGEPVAFEVDHVDAAHSAGWSVLVGGRLHHLAQPPDRLATSAHVTPWAGGDRQLYLRIAIERISGRRIQV